MDLHQVIYSSRPFGYDEATLNTILMDARRANARDGITGALICREDIYLQLLEGPEKAVRAAVSRIARDDRHVDLVVHVDSPVAERLFPDWTMLHDPAASWIWTPKEIADGAAERAGPMQMQALFEQLRARQRTPGGA